jgi:putative NADH-flavin reductase
MGIIGATGRPGKRLADHGSMRGLELAAALLCIYSRAIDELRI